MKIQSIIISLLALTTLFSCENGKESKKDQVVATTNIIANSLKEIVGNDIEIITLMNSETDPHAYSPTPQDYKYLASANVIVSNGLHLEGKLHEVMLQSVEQNKNHHIMMSNGLTKSQIIWEDASIADPHIWFDVNNWKLCVEHAVAELIKIYPEHKETWEANLVTFTSKLTTLDTKIQAEIHSIPDSARVLVTAHDAFSYFSKRYGMRVKPLQGRNTTLEATTNDAIALSNYIVAHKTKSIFVESTVNKKFIEAIQENCHDKGHDVKIGGQLYADALGAEGTPEATYVGMVEYNLNIIVNALK